MEENTTENFVRYHAMRSEILNSLSRMAAICEKLNLKERGESLLDRRRKLQKHRFSVVILGEFKKSKATVISALLGQEIMPYAMVGGSATMFRVTYGPNLCAQVHMMDGSRVDIPIEDLPKYVTTSNDNATAMLERIDEVVVYHPCRFCQNGVDILDAPGLDVDEQKNKLTEDILPKPDAVIMVLAVDCPISIVEAEFIRSELSPLGTERLIFLVNRINTVPSGHRQTVVNKIQEKIRKTVLDKTEEEYGKESAQYRIAQEKLADIRIYPISALDALDGRLDGDEELLRKSGILEFEDGLSRMLTTCELSSPMMEMIRTGLLVRETIRQSRDLQRRAWTQLDDGDHRLLEKTACASKTILSHFSDVLT